MYTAPESKTLNRPNFSVRRYFSVTSLVAIIVVALIFVYLYRFASMQYLLMGGERENVAVTRVLIENIWPKFAPFIDNASEMVSRDLEKHPTYQETYATTLDRVKDLDVLKVKIFDLEGRTVFSTDPAQLGVQQSSNYGGYIVANTGEVITKIVHRDKFKAIQGELKDRWVISSYLPVYDEDKRTIRAVFEVYYDATDSYNLFKRNQIIAFSGVICILSLLYIILFFVSRKADKLILKQSNDLKLYLSQIESQNHKLEEHVQERTEELNKSVDELEKHKLHLEELVVERTTEVTRAKDEAVNANQAKSIFLANMSHELRTPLNAILGYSEIMREDYSDQDSGINKDLNKIYLAGTHY